MPIGSTEQHGPHLPLSTDSDIALGVCERLAVLLPEAVIAPLVPYGSSGEHAGFAGTLSIGQAATELVLVELGRSAFDTFSRVLFVSAHGGNATPVGRAVRQLSVEGHDVALYSVRWDGDAHAGHIETSLQLCLDASRVRTEAIEAGDIRPLAEVLETLQRGGVRAVSSNGVLGDPHGATAAVGDALLTSLAHEAAALLGSGVGVR